MGRHIHIYSLGVDGKVEKIRRRIFLGNKLLVGLHDGAIDSRRIEVTAIDEEILLGILLLGSRRTANIALHLHNSSIDIDLQKIGLYMATHNAYNTLLQRSALQCHNGHIVRHQAKTNLRITESHLSEDTLDGIDHFGAVVVELTTCGSRIEEVTHQKLRTDGTHRGSLRDELASVDNGDGTYFVFSLTGAQFDLRYGSNRSQSLATETKGLQTIQVIKGLDLARCMAVECHTSIHGRHAATIVHYLNKFQTRITEVDRNRRRTRVDGVLHHLLNGRCRIIHDLACRNLVGDNLG